jgi:hypothetical protein
MIVLLNSTLIIYLMELTELKHKCTSSQHECECGTICRIPTPRSADYSILIHEKQIMDILKEYIVYYNSKRPHQGIEQQVPTGYKPKIYGRVLKFPILGGLCHHYIRRAA